MWGELGDGIGKHNVPHVMIQKKKTEPKKKINETQ